MLHRKYAQMQVHITYVSAHSLYEGINATVLYTVAERFFSELVGNRTYDLPQSSENLIFTTRYNNETSNVQIRTYGTVQLTCTVQQCPNSTNVFNHNNFWNFQTKTAVLYF